MSSTIIAMILAAIPSAMLAIATKLFAKSVLQKFLEIILTKTIRAAANATTNTVDDELADLVEQRLNEGA